MSESQDPSSPRRSKLASAAGAFAAKQRAVVSRTPIGGTVAFVRDTALEAQRTKLPQMAAALSYRTIFGLIPVLFISLIALKFFVTEDEIAGALGRALQFSGLSSITVEELPAEALMGPFPEHMPLPGAGGSEVEPPAPVRAHLDKWITDLVQRVGMINFRAISIIGLFALIYAALAMLVEIERCFNQVYRVPIGRSWPRRVTQYWTLLTLGTIFLAATFYIGQRFTAWIVASAAQGGWAGFGGDQQAAVLAGVGYLSTVAISTVLFLLAYTIVPNTRVRLLPALGGAVVAAILWESGKWGFTQYLTFSAGYARLYGSIALIPLFLLWVYVTWVVVLFGLSVSYYLQHGRHRTLARSREIDSAAPAPAIIDPGAILALMLILAARFEKDGRPVRAAVIAGELSLEKSLTIQMLDRLLEAGFVHRVLTADQPAVSGPITENTSFALARPPQQIDAESVLNLAETLVCPLSTSVQPVAQCMRKARHDAVRGRTLASFLDAGEVEYLSPLGPASAPATSPLAPPGQVLTDLPPFPLAVAAAADRPRREPPADPAPAAKAPASRPSAPRSPESR
jgi:membrane protein